MNAGALARIATALARGQVAHGRGWSAYRLRRPIAATWSGHRWDGQRSVPVRRRAIYHYAVEDRYRDSRPLLCETADTAAEVLASLAGTRAVRIVRHAP